MFWRSKRKKTVRRSQSRFLKVEALESRHLLSGVVNVYTDPALGVTPGDLALAGDVSGNSVKIQTGTPSPSTLQFLISSGDGSTLFRLNPTTPGVGPTLTAVTVNGISGSIQVDLGLGNDTFEFAAPAVSPPTQSTVLGNLNIINHVNNKNSINGVSIAGNLNVSKAPGSFGYSELNMAGSTVTGVTIIDNQTGGGGGDSLTNISNSIFLGDSMQSLTITNGDGSDVTYIQGSTQIGTGFFVPGAVVASVDNGDGASETHFNGLSSGTAEVFGGIEITNGATLPLQLSQVYFNATQVLGAVTIDNTDGGDTSVNVLNSRLGSQLVQGGPLEVLNGSGVDQFTMTGSDLPWGLFINNNPLPSGSPWGSITTIGSSTINSRPILSSWALPAPAVPGDAAYIGGSYGPDVVTITATTFFGQLDMALGNGANRVTMDSVVMAALNLQTGTGIDTVWIGGCTIQSSMRIYLGSGADTLSLETGANNKANTLPDALLGFLSIDGGDGVDTLKHDAADPVPINTISFEFIVIG